MSLPDMSLVEALASVSRSTGRRCDLSIWLDTLTQEERDAVRAAIADESKPTRELASTISAHGHSVSQGTIQSHRREQCISCRSLTT
jgi:hypothetical protein